MPSSTAIPSIGSSNSRPLHVYRLGEVDYQKAWDLQKKYVELRKTDQVPDTLFVLSHPPTITLGRNTGSQSLLFGESVLKEAGLTLVESDRGGDATYHGPGQIVVYPILDLRPDLQDIPKFVRLLEQTMINVMAQYGLVGQRVEGAPGAWLSEPDRKIGAVGARISRWITHHGIALNINTNLAHFNYIIPCGLANKGVSSLQKELGYPLDFDQTQSELIEQFGILFNRKIEEKRRDDAFLSPSLS
jgi:lipoyl(octanoyl) transferase